MLRHFGNALVCPWRRLLSHHYYGHLERCHDDIVHGQLVAWCKYSSIAFTLLLQALKTKQKVTDQKLQQTEDSYSQAKQLYDEITDELYEELPTFFDRCVRVDR